MKILIKKFRKYFNISFKLIQKKIIFDKIYFFYAKKPFDKIYLFYAKKLFYKIYLF